MLDKESSSFIVQPFVDKGIRCIIMDYDLCPTVTLEDLVNQIHKFFAWLGDYIKKKGIKRIVVCGHSAGAHLVCFGLSQSFLGNLSDVMIDAMLISGVYYCDELRHLNAANEKNILSLNEENFRELSPQYKNFDYFDDFNVKAHIFVGEFESQKFIQHSKLFAEGPLKKYVENFKVVGCDHFDIVEKFVTDNDYELTKIVLQKLLNH